MPKKALNINDFSGGIVTNKNPRDILDNESQGSNGFVSINPGELTLSSGFIHPVGFQNNEGGYQQEVLSQGMINSWLIQPEYGFRRYIVADNTSSSGGFTTYTSKGTSNFTGDDGSIVTINHGLTTGLRIATIKTGSEPPGTGSFIYATVKRLNDTTFKIPDAAASGGMVLFAIEATYDENGIIGGDVAPEETSVANNKYILKTFDQGMFGFYNIGSYGPGFYGEVDRNAYPGLHGDDPWLFDIQYLWDWNQKGGQVNTSFSTTPVVDAFYDNGNFRVLLKPGEKWEYGFCRRPVTFFHLNNKINFYLDPDIGPPGSSSSWIDVYSNRIMSGWYPVRSHILSPIEYKVEESKVWDATYGDLSKSFTTTDAFDLLLEHRGASCGIQTSNVTAYRSESFQEELAGSNASYYGPSATNRFILSIGLGEYSEDESSNFQKSGDWQFETGDHSRLSFGISYIYDDIEFTRQAESSVSPLDGAYFSDGGEVTGVGWNPTTEQYNALTWDFIDTDGNFGNANQAKDNTALNINLVLNTGSSIMYGPTAPSLLSIGLIPGQNTGVSVVGKFAIPEWRGSNFNDGFSNYVDWNPRIVGVNVWLTGDSTGFFEDPFWLATFDFAHNKKAVSHDGIEGDGWNTSGISEAHFVGQTIRGIKKIPNITYKVKNGYSHDTVTQAWYTTSAVVNRRLYAGNISFFDFPVNKIQDQTNNTLITHKPDRILVSPVNKFDILPVTNFLDVVNEDGQDIVKLVGFGQKLLMFKHNDLFVVDTSGEFEFLENTFKGYGTFNPTMVTQTSEYVFWMNDRGVYAFGQDGEVIDVIKDTLGLKKWKEHYTSSSHISYEPENGSLIIHVSGVGEQQVDKRIFIIDIATGSVFYKSSPSIKSMDYYSNGLNVNNKLYITGSQNAQTDDEMNLYIDTLSRSGAVTSIGEATFKLAASTDSAPAKNRPGDNLHYLLVRKGSSWVVINTSSLNHSGAAARTEITSAERTLYQLNAKCANHADYDVQFDYDDETELFTLRVQANDIGTAYNASAVDLSGGAGAEFGSTAIFAFSSTTATDGSGIHDSNITDWTNSGLDNGTAKDTNSWIFFANRNSSTSKGIAYKIRLHLRVDENDASKGELVLSTTYITGEYDKYKSGRGGAYTYLDDCGGTNSQNTENLIKNFHEFLISNEMIDQFGKKVFFDEYMDMSDIAGSGVNTYFTITTKVSRAMEDFAYLDLGGETYSNTGGNVFLWSNDTTDIANLPSWKSKDFDFGQPNVRKKIYKGYITYKGDAGLKVYYKADQGSSWTQATITGTADNILPASSGFTRKEFKFGSGGNNKYSFAIKLSSTSTLKDIVVNDITLVYRMKNVK